MYLNPNYPEILWKIEQSLKNDLPCSLYRINYNKPMRRMVKQNPNADGPWQEVWEYPGKYHAQKHHLLLVWQNHPCLLQLKQPFSINKKCYGRLCRAPLARLFEFIIKVYTRLLFSRNGRYDIQIEYTTAAYEATKR